MIFSKLIQEPLRVSIVRACQKRSASISSALNSSPVLVSSNKDVYVNLALEHWLYTNLRFNQDDKRSVDSASSEVKAYLRHPIVFIWTDEPCVVIGRHQNPWVETNVSLVNKLGIKLARRHSGGGCVYHDENNINISVIGDRRIFENRQENLRFLAKVLNEKYGIECEPNKRHDLVHSESGLKMSGSASKLGRFNSYHHFTLLVNTDKEIMQAAIRQKQPEFIKTNSSLSTRTKVININELKSDLSVEQIISDLSQAYAKHYKSLHQVIEYPQDSLQMRLDSLKTYQNNLMSWDWLYGMTPKFELERCITFLNQGATMEAKLRVQVNRGLFERFAIDCDLDWVRGLVGKFDHLIDTKFTYSDAMGNVVKMLKNDLAGSEQIFAVHLLRMIHEANQEIIDSTQARQVINRDLYQQSKTNTQALGQEKDRVGH